MADGAGLADGWGGVLCALVLAAAGMAGVSRGDGWGGAVAVGGGGSVGFGICGGAALRLGFWVDGARDACSGRSAAAAGGGGFLPVRAQPYVPGVCGGMDWALDCVWTCRPSSDRR